MKITGFFVLLGKVRLNLMSGDATPVRRSVPVSGSDD